MQMANMKDAQHHASSGKPSQNRTGVALHIPDADNNTVTMTTATGWDSYTLQVPYIADGNIKWFLKELNTEWHMTSWI